jgi:hypothetical protein
MGKRRCKVLPVELAEIGQSGNTFHDLKNIICAFARKRAWHFV